MINILGIYFINQEDLSNGGQEEEFKDSDFLRPKGSAKKSTKLFILNGFMELNTFKQLLEKQKTSSYEHEVANMGLYTADSA